MSEVSGEGSPDTVSLNRGLYDGVRHMMSPCVLMEFNSGQIKVVHPNSGALLATNKNEGLTPVTDG